MANNTRSIIVINRLPHGQFQKTLLRNYICGEIPPFESTTSIKWSKSYHNQDFLTTDIFVFSRQYERLSIYLYTCVLKYDSSFYFSLIRGAHITKPVLFICFGYAENAPSLKAYHKSSQQGRKRYSHEFRSFNNLWRISTMRVQ